MCIDLPERGDPLEVLVDPDMNGNDKYSYRFKPVYNAGVVTSASAETCKFSVREPTGRVTTQQVGRYYEKPLIVGTYLAGFLLYGALRFIGVYDDTKDGESTKTFDKAFEEELEKQQEKNGTMGWNPYSRKVPRPRSGWYGGSTSESDGAAQDVKTKLDFNSEGKVTGHGEDTDDGPYTVEGQWTTDEHGQPSKAKWTETYKQGPRGAFTCTVRATASARPVDKSQSQQKWECTFVSSKDVSGSFSLELLVELLG
jgi:hypothetical protein